jgi:hypothetical protein
MEEISMHKLAALLMLIPVSASASDLSGVWKIDGTVGENPIAATCTMKQTDAELSGSCTMAQIEKAVDLKGTVNDNKVTWKYDVEYQGNTYTLTYDGTPDATATSIKGTIKVGPSDTDGDFTAQKQ